MQSEHKKTTIWSTMVPTRKFKIRPRGYKTFFQAQLSWARIFSWHFFLFITEKFWCLSMLSKTDFIVVSLRFITGQISRLADLAWKTFYNLRPALYQSMGQCFTALTQALSGSCYDFLFKYSEIRSYSFIMCSGCITKTRLFKYIENFISKNWKFSDKKLRYFSYFCTKHRLWVLVRTASPRRF